MEEGAAAVRYQAGSTVCVLDGKERDGQHADHRRYGLALFAKIRWLLPDYKRQ
jgi:hypothetical protein